MSGQYGFHEKDEMLSWLAKERNPTLWHHILCGMNYDLQYTLDYVLWIVQQPDCDVATAVAALQLTYGYEFIYRDFNEVDSPGEDVVRTYKIAKTICDNAGKGHYKRSKIGGSQAFQNESPDQTLIAIHQGCKLMKIDPEKAFLRIPKEILMVRFPDHLPKSEYFIDETAVVHFTEFDESALDMMFGEEWAAELRRR